MRIDHDAMTEELIKQINNMPDAPEVEKGIVTVVMMLIGGALQDLNRIANALEKIAKRNEDVGNATESILAEQRDGD